MARLQWEQVRAPDLSTRDIALAGQTVSAGFDRLATMFQERALRQRQEATDEAVAGILAQTDPNALTKIDPASFGKNVNAREVLEAANQQRRGLIVEADAREDLLSKQALAKHGDELNGLFEAYYNGDEEAKARLVTRSAEDPDGFGRAASAYTLELFNAQRAGIQDRFDVTKHEDGMEIDRGNLRLRGAELNEARNARQQSEEGMNLGIQLAEKYRTLDPADALQAMLEDPLYRNASARTRVGIEAVFERNQGILSTPTGEAAAAWSGTIGQNQDTITQLQAAANRAENQQLSPELTAVRRARELEGQTDANKVLDYLVERGPFIELIGGRSAAAAELERAVTSVEGATYADAQAAMETLGVDRSWFRSPKEALGLSESRLTTQVRKIVDLRKKGYGQNAEMDIAAARAPFERASAQILRLQQQILRYEDAGEPVPEHLLTRLNKLRSEASRR